MALGGWTIRPPGLRRCAYQPGLGILPHLITIPHFDQSGRWLPAPLFAWLVRHAPPGSIVLGIDEDTALLRRPVPGDPAAARWEVQGRQTVTVFDRADPPARTVYRVGEEVNLPFA